MKEGHTVVFEVAVIRIYWNWLPCSRRESACFGFHKELRFLFGRGIPSPLFTACEGKCNFGAHVPVEVGFSKASPQKIEQTSILVYHRDYLNLLDQELLLVACRTDKITGWNNARRHQHSNPTSTGNDQTILVVRHGRYGVAGWIYKLPWASEIDRIVKVSTGVDQWIWGQGQWMKMVNRGWTPGSASSRGE